MGALFLLNVGGLRDLLVGEPDPRIDSIAVLPLDNLSGDPEQDYFADGMTDALITELSKIGTLKVISRTSAMLYKDSEQPLPEIAAELNVEAVVEGSVFRTGDRVRVTAQLIHAATDQNLWADNYDRDLRDILALYSEVARAIASEIKVKLTAQEESLLARAGPVDLEALEAYLRGNHFANRRTLEGWRRGIDYYEQAIEKDPQYAPAYAALAHTLATLPMYSNVPSEEFFPRARDAAQTAIELDDTLATAHIALARAEYRYYWDWEVAEREIQRAIELDPGSAEAHMWFGHYLVWMGQSEEGVAAGRHALELDPLSLPTNMDLGWMLYNARRFDEAIEHLSQVLDLEPNTFEPHLCLFFTYAKKEQYEHAFASLQNVHDLQGLAEPITHHPFYAYLHALWGKREEALRPLSAPGWAEIGSWSRAVAHGALGDKDEAFRLLEEDYEQRGRMLVLSRIDPKLDPLRDDPRFQDFLRRMNFPE
jgi:TolB-like protein/Tfp pilus assembly protein PilF